LAPAPTKDAASSDMPREDASNLRSGDFRMRLRAAVPRGVPGNGATFVTNGPAQAGKGATGCMPVPGAGTR